jgi:hypothetical protein
MFDQIEWVIDEMALQLKDLSKYTAREKEFEEWYANRKIKHNIMLNSAFNLIKSIDLIQKKDNIIKCIKNYSDENKKDLSDLLSQALLICFAIIDYSILKMNYFSSEQILKYVSDICESLQKWPRKCDIYIDESWLEFTNLYKLYAKKYDEMKKIEQKLYELSYKMDIEFIYDSATVKKRKLLESKHTRCNKDYFSVLNQLKLLKNYQEIENMEL